MAFAPLILTLRLMISIGKCISNRVSIANFLATGLPKIAKEWCIKRLGIARASFCYETLAPIDNPCSISAARGYVEGASPQAGRDRAAVGHSVRIIGEDSRIARINQYFRKSVLRSKITIHVINIVSTALAMMCLLAFLEERAMATEIVALGHKSGIVMLADKRAVTRRESCQPIQTDSAIKIAQIEKTGGVAFAGIAQIAADGGQTIDLFEELAKLVSGKRFTTDEDRKILIEQLNSQYQRAPINLLVSNVKRIPPKTFNGRVLYPLYSLLFITTAPHEKYFDIALASVYLEELTDNSFNYPYELQSTKYYPAAKDSHFVSIMGAQSSEAQTLSQQKPENYLDALRLAASEIRRTHLQRQRVGSNDVGNTCDALILSSTGTHSIANSSLDDLISGKVKVSKKPLEQTGLHLPKMNFER